MYKAQICYSTAVENGVKEIVYASLSENNSVRDAVAFAYNYVKQIDCAELTFLKVHEYRASTISPDGRLLNHRGNLLFAWDFRNTKVIKDFLRKLRNKDIDKDWDDFGFR